MPERLRDEQRSDRRQRPADPGRRHVHGLRRRPSAPSAPTMPRPAQQRWLFRTIALDGEPGGDSWGGLPDLYRAGGEAWITGSYDPDLNLTYWGTAQAKPWMPASRGMATTDVALYTSATLALDATTGDLKWHYAHAPGETFDLDVVFERVLVDAGNEKWVLSVGKDGVLWKHDRATGEYLGHAETVFQNVWASFDPETGRPRYRPDILEHKVGEWIDACPSTAGGKNWHAMSFHAPTRQLIIPLEPKLRVAARASHRASAGRRQRRRRRPALLYDAGHERQRRQARRVQRRHARAGVVARATRVVHDVGVVDGRRRRVRRRSRSQLQSRGRARRQRRLGDAACDLGARLSRSALRSTASSTSRSRQGSAAAAHAACRRRSRRSCGRRIAATRSMCSPWGTNSGALARPSRYSLPGTK